MTQSDALRGFLFSMAGVTLVGAIWGGIARPEICCGGNPGFLDAAQTGGMIALVVFSLPIGLIWVFIASGDAARERSSERKPDPHPLDD